MQQCRVIYCSLAALHVSSDIFTHHQEHLNCIYSFWYYTLVSLPTGCRGDFQLAPATSRQRHGCIIPEAANTVQMLLIMSENIARNMQSSQGTINYPTPLHLVGHFRKLYLDARNHEYQAIVQLQSTKYSQKFFRSQTENAFKRI